MNVGSIVLDPGSAYARLSWHIHLSSRYVLDDARWEDGKWEESIHNFVVLKNIGSNLIDYIILFECVVQTRGCLLTSGIVNIMNLYTCSSVGKPYDRIENKVLDAECISHRSTSLVEVYYIIYENPTFRVVFPPQSMQNKCASSLVPPEMVCNVHGKCKSQCKEYSHILHHFWTMFSAYILNSQVLLAPHYTCTFISKIW